eukprot:6563713-Alexandrium_andersonii.AAC.1
MSASLVGSEMCIRDRPFMVSAPWKPSKGEAETISHADVAMLLPHDWAVSYTHLTLPTICSV